MAWIEIVPEGEATGPVKGIYERSRRGSSAASSHGGHISEIIKVFSLRPEMMEARVEFANAITFGGSGLGRRKEELIATAISGLLDCKY